MAWRLGAAMACGGVASREAAGVRVALERRQEGLVWGETGGARVVLARGAAKCLAR